MRCQSNLFSTTEKHKTEDTTIPFNRSQVHMTMEERVGDSIDRAPGRRIEAPDYT